MRAARGDRWGGWAGAVVVAAGCLALSGCLTVKLISGYDEQIDSGVTAVLADATAFVTRMNGVAGTPDGDYDHNRDFYSDEHGKIVALEARAAAIKVAGGCPTTTAAAAVARTFHASDPVLSALQQAPADDCLGTELTLLDGALGDLQTFHQAQGPRGVPAAADGPILEGGFGSIARTIIFIEARAKAGAAAGAGQSGAKPDGA